MDKHYCPYKNIVGNVKPLFCCNFNAENSCKIRGNRIQDAGYRE
jgi:hypothetical protein